MLTMFLRGQRDRVAVDLSADGLPEDAIWLDMRDPSPEEAGFVRRTVGIEMPTREEMREIEASARVYEEDGALFLTATVLVNADTPPPGTTEITFILKGDRLVTLRYADPQPFRTMPARLERQGAGLGSAQGVLFWLIELVVARIADVLERASLDIDTLSGEIFGAANAKPKDERPDLLRAIERIGRAGDTAARARESLLTLARILLSLGATDLLPPGSRKEARARAKLLNRDVASLTDHAAFLSGKISLLLEATLGMINIEQNAIIKIFSVVAVVFMPPTMIASIYGMNFKFLPELDWPLGYPMALLLMALSAVIPLLYFRKRGWL
ncbi:magnesium transporter CorA family protein [Benzoatithermus flavus]|uniref:Magnesium transporter CorA family protein n=1 Tax=Benzoatithermus flavus TaxID=3108223 RepID=A0ABU8XMY3_9PROT